MSDYEKSFYDMIPAADAHAAKLQRDADRAARAEAQRLAEDQEKARQLAEADTRSRELAARAFMVLIREGVPDLSIVSKRRTGYVHEVGRGWHVFTRNFTTRDQKTERVGIDKDGGIITFDLTMTTDGDGAEWNGIVMPDRLNDAERRLEILQSERFRLGMGSLIAGHGPYEFVETPKPADDPEQPALPGM